MSVTIFLTHLEVLICNEMKQSYALVFCEQSADTRTNTELDIMPVCNGSFPS